MVPAVAASKRTSRSVPRATSYGPMGALPRPDHKAQPTSSPRRAYRAPAHACATPPGRMCASFRPLIGVRLAPFFEQPKLEDVRGIEPVDSQGGSRGSGGGSTRHEADELGADHFCPADFRFALDRPNQLVQAGSFPILDVHAHLHEPRSLQREAESAHTRKAAVTLADDRGDLASRGELAAQVDIQRDQRS